jgi:hypothetical protein
MEDEMGWERGTCDTNASNEYRFLSAKLKERHCRDVLTYKRR